MQAVLNDHTLNMSCLTVNHVPFVAGQPQKKSIRPIVKAIKYMKDVYCVDQLCSVQLVNKVHYCSKSACRGQTAPVLENLGHPRGQSQGHKKTQGRLHPPLLEPSNFD